MHAIVAFKQLAHSIRQINAFSCDLRFISCFQIKLVGNLEDIGNEAVVCDTQAAINVTFGVRKF
jgi:hypothetical protein